LVDEVLISANVAAEPDLGGRKLQEQIYAEIFPDTCRRYVGWTGAGGQRVGGPQPGCRWQL
jgi:hypothetical protein